ncbi:MAG: type IV pili methyl-accepting chemotaxis transducer N-terminal domain-containing protein [Gammaproteobacteria bacterium]|nr:type IV pili methyl-accepting chemotaxis transducer N-terminal domain-containing protein [Gammaproteobacteria bacterium]
MAKTTRENIPGQGTSRILIFYLIGLLISVIVLASLYGYVAVQTLHDKEYDRLVNDNRLNSLHIARSAYQASLGDPGAFDVLQKNKERFDKALDTLINGETSSGLPPSPASVKEELTAVEDEWQQFRDKIDTILSFRESMLSMRQATQNIEDITPGLIAISDEVVADLISNRANQYQIYIATRQLMLGERIAHNVDKVLTGGSESAIAADRFGRDAALFNRILNGMLNGNSKINRVSDPETREKIRQVSERFSLLSTNVGAILERSPEVFQVKDATNDIIEDREDGHLNVIEQRLANLSSAYDKLGEELQLMSNIADGFGVIAFVLLILSGLRLRKDGQIRLEAAEQQRKLLEEQNNRNQMAILRLLDELGDLADGDLSVHATVTEDITGAIADSINYAIDAMRNVVTAINDTTGLVSTAADEAQSKVRIMAARSSEEAQNISAASQDIYIMANTIDDMSRDAASLADEAQKSVGYAVAGAETVQRTIDGMDSIREHIQDTAKRIKRLGESSQQIGDIIELIDDIAEQTNILALNASIQSAMAGEAGRGFSIVADEVQQLAERASNSTKQIEGLIKSIQTETNEAIASMEQSTQGVVSGAQLAQEAGEALLQIESVSKSLAELIQNISSTSHHYVEEAENIRENMKHISESATENSQEINATAETIGNLSSLSTELKKSVSGFKLPS